MKYLRDTNHWSYLQRNHPGVRARVQSLPDEATIYMPVITPGELLVGVELAAGESRKQELRTLYEQAVTKATDILPVNPRVAEQYASVFVNLRRKGRPIETNDFGLPPLRGPMT